MVKSSQKRVKIFSEEYRRNICFLLMRDPGGKLYMEGIDSEGVLYSGTAVVHDGRLIGVSGIALKDNLEKTGVVR